MTKRIGSIATTTSRTTLRTTPQDESAKPASIAHATTATPATNAPGSAPASAGSTPSPEATAPLAAPTTGPEAPTNAGGAAGAEAGAGASETGKKGGAAQIVTRFPPELVARLDRFTDSLRNGRFGLRVSRADAVRILVNEGLAHFEKETTASGVAGK